MFVVFGQTCRERSQARVGIYTPSRGGPRELQGLLPGRSGKRNMADRITQLQDALNQVYSRFIDLDCANCYSDRIFTSCILCLFTENGIIDFYFVQADRIFNYVSCMMLPEFWWFFSLQISFVTVLEYCSKQLSRKRNLLALTKVSSVNKDEFYIRIVMECLRVYNMSIKVLCLCIWKRLVSFFVCSWRSKFCLFWW